VHRQAVGGPGRPLRSRGQGGVIPQTPRAVICPFASSRLGARAPRFYAGHRVFHPRHARKLGCCPPKRHILRTPPVPQPHPTALLFLKSHLSPRTPRHRRLQFGETWPPPHAGEARKQILTKQTVLADECVDGRRSGEGGGVMPGIGPKTEQIIMDRPGHVRVARRPAAVCRLPAGVTSASFCNPLPPEGKVRTVGDHQVFSVDGCGRGTEAGVDQVRPGRTDASTSGWWARAARKVPRAGQGSADASGGILSFCFRLLQRSRSLLRCEGWVLPPATRAEATLRAPKPHFLRAPPAPPPHPTERNKSRRKRVCGRMRRWAAVGRGRRGDARGAIQSKDQ
jgi:hypothetical protein